MQVRCQIHDAFLLAFMLVNKNKSDSSFNLKWGSVLISILPVVDGRAKTKLYSVMLKLFHFTVSNGVLHISTVVTQHTHTHTLKLLAGTVYCNFSGCDAPEQPRCAMKCKATRPGSREFRCCHYFMASCATRSSNIRAGYLIPIKIYKHFHVGFLTPTQWSLSNYRLHWNILS